MIRQHQQIRDNLIYDHRPEQVKLTRNDDGMPTGIEFADAAARDTIDPDAIMFPRMGSTPTRVEHLGRCKPASIASASNR